MSIPDELDLAYGILDHQIIDSEDRRCGKVDDLELEGKVGEELRVAALLVGLSAWSGRLPGRLGRMVARHSSGKLVRIPWEDVKEVNSAVQLGRTAAELGLGRGEERWARRIARIPGS
jgi:sporulation protein YlmC with PRC-barrel domain